MRACRACGLPGSMKNPLIDYVHAQDCMIYMASGACACGHPGYWAHRYRCPVPVEGDHAPKVPEPLPLPPPVSSVVYGPSPSKRGWFFKLEFGRRGR